ncbi:Mpo1-like protein [Rhodoblastus sp.]|uniref:Mpo1-like protein n=1 Tax=Rhodoblastus sp. TaxID=1962975 RepID=UPI003F9DF11A
MGWRQTNAVDRQYCVGGKFCPPADSPGACCPQLRSVQESDAMPGSSPNGGFACFADFYQFYLGEHANRACRRLHFVGTTLALFCLVAFVLSGGVPWWFLSALGAGYGFAWVGHFFFEKNRPATFKFPIYSLMGDWVMWWEILRGRIAF